MTSLTYDDSIEIISYHTDDAPSGLGVSATASAASVDGTATATAYVSFSGRRQLTEAGGGGARHGVRASVAGRRHPNDSMSPQYRRMRCAVIVMASVMILASMLLVGVSLSMAEHIDELGLFSAITFTKIVPSVGALIVGHSLLDSSPETDLRTFPLAALKTYRTCPLFGYVLNTLLKIT